ncbi:MAG: 5-oxopent-3-ene-1,2,5-tricarboxylate decarboxylase, partial [Anaerolineae bacterium]|nr:5-oxopent-3-ene-1,2,5-tricarboxylate decarboxylase [Anaerolineae bacterium]
MRLLTYLHEGQARVGALVDGGVVDLGRAYHLSQLGSLGHCELGCEGGYLFGDMLSVLCGGEAALRAARAGIASAQAQLEASGALRSTGIGHRWGDVVLLPPVRRPGKIICVGLNYPALGQASDADAPRYPVLFHKVPTTLTGDGQPIVLPRISREVVYEGELAVVIGRQGKHIEREHALSYVAGYTIANDVGALDLERRTPQWATGKLADTFCPMGPFLVTRDEVPDPGALAIETTLNGELVQSGSTGEMIFDVPYLVSYISALTTLEPGDLILTGSPKRLGDLPAPRRFMKPGDRVSVRIEELGELTNPVVDE